MRISRRSLAALARDLSTVSHGDLDALFFEFEVQHRDPSGNRLSRCLAFLQAVEESRASEEAEAVVLEIAKRLLTRTHLSFVDPAPSLDAFLASVELDGFAFSEHRFIATTPAPVTLDPEISALERELEAYDMKTASEHYRQAVDNFTQRKWESANAQIRSFAEDLFIRMARELCSQKRSDPNASLQDLRNVGHLDEAEFNQTRAFWAGIQDNGPHSGLSSEQEALFRVHVGTAIARYLLAKIGGRAV